MKQILGYLCGLLVVWLPLAGLSAKDDPVLMRVGGRDVPRSEFEYVYRTALLDSVEHSWSLKELVRSYADFQLKVQAARQAGLDTLPGFRAEQAAYRAGLLRHYLVDSATLERALHRRYERMAARGPRVRVIQIFRRLPQNVTHGGVRAAEGQMDSLYAVLQQKGGRIFDELVARFSDDKSARWVRRLDETAEFEDSIYALKLGAWSRPFFTPRGLHIVRVLAREAVPPYEAVRDSLLRAYPSCVDEAAYAWVARQLASGGKRLSDKQLREGLAAACSRLERQDTTFVLMLQAHGDSLLAKAVTRREVDSRIDSVALQHYFVRHHARYRWQTPRYRGIVLLCSSRRVAKQARKMLKHLPQKDWLDAIRLLLNKNGVQVQARQGTFAPGEDEWVDERIFKKGEAPEREGFRHVVLMGRKLKGPEHYREVEQAVEADWQASCESRWLSGLREAAKVEINQEVLKTVNYHRNKR